MNLLKFATIGELKGYLTKFNIPTYRAEQLFDWVYKKNVFDFAQMSNIPKDFKNKIPQNDSFSLPTVKKIQKSIDGTKKVLLELEDKKLIEMVIIPNKKKNTLCVSSQVGCKIGCRFCATAKMGFLRNLYFYEIISQYLLCKKIFPDDEVGNIVFMGMGEPLINYQELIKSLKMFKDILIFNPKRITVSTCGIIPGIIKLSQFPLKVKLAVSLFSPIQKIRKQYIPIAKKYPLDKLKKCLLSYVKTTKRSVTIEYLLMNEINLEDIKSLKRFLGDISCKLNVIPYNSICNDEIVKKIEIEKSVKLLKKNLPFAVTLRKKYGDDIQGACGQLVVENY